MSVSVRTMVEDTKLEKNIGFGIRNLTHSESVGGDNMVWLELRDWDASYGVSVSVRIMVEDTKFEQNIAFDIRILTCNESVKGDNMEWLELRE